MADSQTTPLTDAERAELEELRALKAQREEEERARKERAELEALRAERAAASKPEALAAPKAVASATPAPAPALAATPTSATAPQHKEKPVVDPENLTFAQRMVLGDSASTSDEDDIPGMPPAQKIIVILAIACVIGFGIWMVLNK